MDLFPPLFSSVHKVGLEEVTPGGGGGSSVMAVRPEPSMRVLSLRPNMEAFFRMNWVKWCGDGALQYGRRGVRVCGVD